MFHSFQVRADGDTLADMAVDERLVFGHTMEALLQRCGRHLTRAQWAELAKWGVVPEKIQPAYEFSQWCRVLEYVARLMHPELPVGDAEYLLGRDFIEKYAETLIGRALFAMLRLLGTQRTVRRLARSFRTGTSFTEIEVRDMVEDGCVVLFNIVEPRGRVTEGVLARGLEVAGVRGLKVVLQSLDGESATYRLSWQ